MTELCKKQHRQTRDLLYRNNSKNDIFVKFIQFFLHKIIQDLFKLFVIQCTILYSTEAGDSCAIPQNEIKENNGVMKILLPAINI